jgi:hypothetical protein
LSLIISDHHWSSLIINDHHWSSLIISASLIVTDHVQPAIHFNSSLQLSQTSFKLDSNQLSLTKSSSSTFALISIPSKFSSIQLHLFQSGSFQLTLTKSRNFQFKLTKFTTKIFQFS